MKHITFRVLALLVIGAAGNLLAFSQVTSTSSISGAVVDPSGAVVAGAVITVKNDATGEESRATSAGNGTFTVPALTAGVYKITVAAPGFKQALVQGIKIDAGVPATVNISMEIGAATDSVIIQSSAEVLQTQSANISTTITGRQITDLPFTSRNATDLLLFQPGTVTPGRPRSSSFNGLPQGAINMTLDGLNIQDNAIKNGDGFYTQFYPRTDAVQEVTLSTATPGAESAGEGAIQIKMVTRYGGNAFHGSLYEYHRNPALNANYWFNNRDLRPPKDRLLLNQFGGRFEGPIVIPKLFDGHDKAFFFVNYEQFRLATQVSQNRSVLSPQAQQGDFQWKVKQGNQTTIQKVNLFDLAARSNCAPAGQPARPCVSTIDPTVAKLLGDIRSATQTSGSLEVVTDPNLIVDPNIQRYAFSPVGGGEIRVFPTLRLDFNIGSKHHLEGSYLPQTHHTLIDYLNNGAPAFPGFPSFGSQISTRFGSAIALRSTLTNTLTNEARFTFSGGTVTFNSEGSAANYTGALANQAGFNLGSGTPGAGGTTGIVAAAGVNGATVSTNIQRRNAPIKQFSDTVNWTRGSHTLNLGANFTQVNYFQSVQNFAPSINFGVDQSDPANGMFNTTNFPGAINTDLANARGLYATLVGSVTAITASSFLDEETGKYVYNGLRVRRARMREIGLFAQDGWRAKPNLTLNYGLRWEVQLSVVPKNNNLSTTTVAGLYGVSGPGGPTQFTQFKEGDKAFNTNLGNFAPSLGFAWTPNWKSGLLSKVFGSDGKSVIRGGFSIAYNREGIGDILDTLVNNPGGTLTSTRSVTNNNLGSLPVLLSQTSRLGPPVVPDSPVYPITNQPGGYLISDAASIYDSNYKLPYVMSWSFGLQREITKDTAIEVRYVGNRGLRNRTTYNLNDINIVGNGFLNEFKLAQRNLESFKAANPNCSTPGNPLCSFAYKGLPGQAPLPIILAYFSGIPAGQAGDTSKYTSTLFTNTTFVNPLVVNNAAPYTFAQSLYNSTGQRSNALAAGLAPNFFLVNPNLQGGASFTGNGGHTYYDSAVVELRRRMSKGLLVQGSYVFARGFTLTNTSISSPYFKTLSPLVINHAFKADWIYDLPFGHGQWLLGNSRGVIGKAVEGWSFQGGARLQSGAPVVFNGFQTNAPGDTLPNGLTGLRLVGMTAKELQKSVKMRFDDAARVAYFLPQDIIDNTIKAFSVSATSPTGYGSLGAPTGRYIAPANRADCIEAYAGQCGFPNLVLYGPRFTRFDLSMIKRTRITEKVDFEFRAEFLNAFNNINFSIQNPSNATTTVRGTSAGPPAGVANNGFGRVGFAYRDISTTNDPGGRIIQFVGRINF
jgi:hypothetical protein